MATSPLIPVAQKQNWFKRVFEDIFGGKASWEKTAATALTFAGPILDTIVEMTGGAAAAASTQKILSDISSNLALATKVLLTTSGDTAKQQAQQYIQNVLTNLPALLAAADVKNSAKLAEITTYANLLGGELNAILTAY